MQMCISLRISTTIDINEFSYSKKCEVFCADENKSTHEGRTVYCRMPQPNSFPNLLNGIFVVFGIVAMKFVHSLLPRYYYSQLKKIYNFVRALARIARTKTKGTRFKFGKICPRNLFLD